MHTFEEKDWYYNIEKEGEKPERCGPVTFSEVCIAFIFKIEIYVLKIFNFCCFIYS